MYEGYAPHGVPVLVVGATDNPTHTVANIRLHFSKGGGSMGNRICFVYVWAPRSFQIRSGKLNLDELELDLIDAGAEDIQRDEEETIVYTKFVDFGQMAKFAWIEKSRSQELRAPIHSYHNKELPEDQQDEVLSWLKHSKQTMTVQSVFHNLA